MDWVADPQTYVHILTLKLRISPHKAKCSGSQGMKVISSVQFSHSVMSDSLRTHELQHARPPCPSPTPGVHPNPCPLSQWCHPTISSPVIPFSSYPQSFPASGSFPMSQLFTWGGQSIGVSRYFISIKLFRDRKRGKKKKNFCQKTRKDLKNQELSLEWLNQLIKNPTSDRNGI